MTRKKQTQQLSKQGKLSDKKTAGKMLLPGSDRIEKALTFPTTGRPNPFLDRLDPALAKPPPDSSAKPPPDPPAEPSEK